MAVSWPFVSTVIVSPRGSVITPVSIWLPVKSHATAFGWPSVTFIVPVSVSVTPTLAVVQLNVRVALVGMLSWSGSLTSPDNVTQPSAAGCVFIGPNVCAVLSMPEPSAEPTLCESA